MWQAASEWLYVVPWGIRKVLNYIAQRYNNPPIYVTENGIHSDIYNRVLCRILIDAHIVANWIFLHDLAFPIWPIGCYRIIQP